MKMVIYLREKNISVYSVSGMFKDKTTKMVDTIENYKKIPKHELVLQIKKLVGNKALIVVFDGDNVVTKSKDVSGIKKSDMRGYYANNIEDFFTVKETDYKFSYKYINSNTLLTSALLIDDYLAMFTEGQLKSQVEHISTSLMATDSYLDTDTTATSVYIIDGNAIITYVFNKGILQYYATKVFEDGHEEKADGQKLSIKSFVSNHNDIDSFYRRSHKDEGIQSVYIINSEDNFKDYKNAISEDGMHIIEFDLSTIINMYVNIYSDSSNMNFVGGAEKYYPITKYTKHLGKIVTVLAIVSIITIGASEAYYRHSLQGVATTNSKYNSDIAAENKLTQELTTKSTQLTNQVTQSKPANVEQKDTPAQEVPVAPTIINVEARLQELANAVGPIGKINAIKITSDGITVNLRLNCGVSSALNILTAINKTGYYKTIELNKVALYPPTQDILLNLIFNE